MSVVINIVLPDKTILASDGRIINICEGMSIEDIDKVPQSKTTWQVMGEDFRKIWRVSNNTMIGSTGNARVFLELVGELHERNAEKMSLEILARNVKSILQKMKDVTYQTAIVTGRSSVGGYFVHMR